MAPWEATKTPEISFLKTVSFTGHSPQVHERTDGRVASVPLPPVLPNVRQTVGTFMTPPVSSTLQQRLVGQVERTAVRAVQSGVGRIRLVLNPPTLGRVTLVINRRGDSLRAILHVENPTAQQLLSANLPELEGRLAKIGSPPLQATVAVMGTSTAQDASGPGEQRPKQRSRKVKAVRSTGNLGRLASIAEVWRGILQAKGGVAT